MPLIKSEFEIVGSIASDEVPPEAVRLHGGRAGPLYDLAQRIITEHEHGRVVMLRVKDDINLRRIRNGTQKYLNAAGLSLRVSTTGSGDQRRAYMEVVPHVPLPRKNGST